MNNETNTTTTDETAHERKRLKILIRSLDEKIDDLMLRIESIESERADFQAALDALDEHEDAP